MEQKQKSTKKFLNKIFHPSGNKKNSSTVSPHENEFAPSFVALDLSNHGSYPQRPSLNSAKSSTNSNNSNEPFHYERPGSVHRRYSFSNVHENGRQKLLAAKRKEYQEKMEAFDDLIQRRRGVTLTNVLNSEALSR
ncbi:7219_t:CDS:1 [Cetraspora pellucida]|uniref:7219_t:CDS:1 n=1 Tax=Cetraspora pellucida TaxID=1433469 RepID=A0A9N8W986_9GLOM|nr:7219_t:CDS:1 [Cetraspora pellucida]